MLTIKTLVACVVDDSRKFVNKKVTEKKSDWDFSSGYSFKNNHSVTLPCLSYSLFRVTLYF